MENEEKLREKIKYHIWEPLSWQRGLYNIRNENCRFSVQEYGRGGTSHQCNHKVKENIFGYGFCTRHANEIKNILGMPIDESNFFWKWYVKVEFYPLFGIEICKVQLQETKNGYKVIKILSSMKNEEFQNLNFPISYTSYISRIANDDNNIHLFDELLDALKFIRSMYDKRAENSRKAWEDASEISRQLNILISKEF